MLARGDVVLCRGRGGLVWSVVGPRVTILPIQGGDETDDVPRHRCDVPVINWPAAKALGFAGCYIKVTLAKRVRSANQVKVGVALPQLIGAVARAVSLETMETAIERRWAQWGRGRKAIDDMTAGYVC